MTEGVLQEKYLTRDVNQERSQELRDLCDGFLNELNQELENRSIQYRFENTGSVMAGYSVHKVDDALILHDVDITIKRSDPDNIDPVTREESLGFIEESILLPDRIKTFLNGELKEFVDARGIDIQT